MGIINYYIKNTKKKTCLGPKQCICVVWACFVVVTQTNSRRLFETSIE